MEDLENSLCVNNLYRNMDLSINPRPYFSSIGVGTKNSAGSRRECDETFYGGAQIMPDQLPSRPISQMGYDELVTYHLRKYV